MPRNEIPEHIRKYVNPFRIETGKDFRLNDFDPGETRGLDKGEAADFRGSRNCRRLGKPGPRIPEG